MNISDIEKRIRYIRESYRLSGAPMFLGIPRSWIDGGLFRCSQGHVSNRTNRVIEAGDYCVACHGKVMRTFPEDVTGPLIVWKEHPPEAGGRSHEYQPQQGGSCVVCGNGPEHGSHFDLGL